MSKQIHEQDPLAGDIDRFVHPDETRTDEQIKHDEGVSARLHMSGDDGADEYWADYDAYHGTVNGGEDPLSLVQEGEEEVTIPAQSERRYGMVAIRSPKGRTLHVNRNDLEAREAEGVPAQEIGRQYDVKQDETDKQVAAYRKRQKELFGPKDEEEWEEIQSTEDPLAGDVDRFVHPDETKD